MCDDSIYFDTQRDPADPIIPQSLMDSSSSNDCLLENHRLLPSFHLEDPYAEADMGLDHLHHQLGFDIIHGVEAGPPLQLERANWDVSYSNHLLPPQYPDPAYLRAGAAVPDLLNLLELPRCAAAPPVFQSSISFDGMAPVLYDPMIGAPQPGVLRDLFGSLPQSYGLFCGMEEREGGGVEGEGDGIGGFEEMVGRRQFEGVLDYRREMGKGEVKGSVYCTERQRRVQMNGKFTVLRSLVPNPGKSDRTSTVDGAIQYIKELLRTTDELKLLVEKKRRGRERCRQLRAEEEAAACNVESSTTIISGKDDHENTISGPLRSSWLQRRSKETFVDVRIIEDEVNIKLTQKKKVSTLLFAVTALDELRLDLSHMAGGNIGDYHIFMFNAKICEGSSVYAGAIANKLLEAMAKHGVTKQFAGSY